MSESTKIISVHKYRWVARLRERAIQRKIDLNERPAEVPIWADGVRVESAGEKQHAVVATEHRGH